MAIAVAVSPAAFEQAYKSLKPGGTLIFVAMPADNFMQLPIFETVLHGITVVGSIVGTRVDLAETFELLATRPRSLRGGVSSVPALCHLIEGRGACRHPDGAVRFARTALRVFDAHTALHLQRGPCHTGASPVLVVPATARVP